MRGIRRCAGVSLPVATAIRDAASPRSPFLQDAVAASGFPLPGLGGLLLVGCCRLRLPRLRLRRGCLRLVGRLASFVRMFRIETLLVLLLAISSH